MSASASTPKPASATAPKVLAVADYFWPGYRGGGVITAVANVIQQLGGTFVFELLTSDHDLGATEPYANVTGGAWNETRFGRVYYSMRSQRNPAALRRVLCDVPFDLLYLNSFFSPLSFHLLLLRRLGLLRRTPVVLAPRGEFAQSALRARKMKKQVYEKVMRLGLLDGVIWQASSDHEVVDITEFFRVRHRGSVTCINTGEVPSVPDARPAPPRAPKRAGRVSAMFVGRVHRIKNLDFAIRLVARATGDVELTIAGQMEDPVYWKECEALIAALPAGKSVKWAGVFPPEELARMLVDADLMILPTRGENFGHALLESFAAGCPVLTSDQTPWKGLAQRGVGWDIPLADFDASVAALNTMSAMDEHGHAAMRERSRAFALSAVPDAVQKHRDLFEQALKCGSS